MSQRNSENEIGSEGASNGEGRGSGVQGHINAHFDSTASYWDGVYRGGDLQGLIYQLRQAAVLDNVVAAEPGPGAPILEIGCGAGHLTVQLAKRGLKVDAVDASQAMVDTTAGQLARENLSENVTVGPADVHSLPFESAHFDLVVAVGVLPWLHTPGDAVREMTRVLRPGGEIVLTADNRARMTSFMDPRAMLALSPLKRALVALRQRRGQASSRLDYPRRIDRLLREAGLNPVERRTVGFGPLTFMGRSLFSEALNLRISDRLEALAARGTPALRWMGWHYVVRARKP